MANYCVGNIARRSALRLSWGRGGDRYHARWNSVLMSPNKDETRSQMKLKHVGNYFLSQ